MRRSDPLPPVSPRFVAFAWRYHRGAGALLPATADARSWAPGSWCSGSRAGIIGGDGRVSQVPGDPSCASALFSDPGGTEYARPLRRIGMVPAADKSEDSREKLSRLNRTAWALAVYASQGELLAKLCRAGFVHPQGSDERFPSFESLPPLPELLGVMPCLLNRKPSACDGRASVSRR